MLEYCDCCGEEHYWLRTVVATDGDGQVMLLRLCMECYLTLD